MPFTLTPQGLVATWRHATLPERSPAQEPCIGLCGLTARPTLDQFNPTGAASTSVLACGTPPRAGLGRRSEAWLLRLGTQGQTRCLAEALQNRFMRWGCCSFSALGRTSHATLILQRDSDLQGFLSLQQRAEWHAAALPTGRVGAQQAAQRLPALPGKGCHMSNKICPSKGSTTGTR